MKFIILALLLLIPAAAFADDGLPVEVYEERIEGWCAGLVDNYGWQYDVDGSVTGWPGGCWRDADGRPSWEECLAIGYEWDCPQTQDEQVEPQTEESSQGRVAGPVPTRIDSGTGGFLDEVLHSRYSFWP